eukprot:TRINITY_DN953_c0_g1_i2.p1 TRINITY_DN953_c0_g1~~TRINITY_DN953_c0_g1_i2.p1  ORF type:complete len:796 (+),score=98.22 TRINITY_DN953_c0_g1_i2:906-3293(+)
MGRLKDAIWEQVEKLPNGKMKCKHCSFQCPSNATKIKEHLECFGTEIQHCRSVPTELKLKLQQQRAKDRENLARDEQLRQAASGESAAEVTTGLSFAPRVSMNNPRNKEEFQRIRDMLNSRARQSNLPDWYKTEKKALTDAAYLRFKLVEKLPFHLSKSPWAREFYDRLSEHGPGWEPPSEYEQKGTLLDAELTTIKDKLVDMRKSFVRYGCTIICDGWTDRQGRALLNFLAANHRGAMFLFTIDAGGDRKTGEWIETELKKAMANVGEENVVQVVMDNAGANRLASELLVDEFAKLHYTNCAAHCLDLLLEDIGKENWVARNISAANAIVKYVRNKTWVRALFRTKSPNRTLLRPNKTRFATSWLMLQRLHDRRAAIHEMVADPVWEERPTRETVADRDLNRRVSHIIYDMHFWDRCKAVVNVMLPVYRALRLMDQGGATMGIVWSSMARAKKDMTEALIENLVPRDLAWRIEDLANARMGQGWVLNPLHSVAWLLHPANRKAPFEERQLHRTAFITYATKMFDDDASRATLDVEYGKYFEGEGAVGLPQAELGRESVKEGRMHPWVWWELYGYELELLMKVACRILTQPSTASDCERNWASHAAIHTVKRARLTSELLGKCVFADHNLRLIKESESGKTKKKRKHAELTVGEAGDADARAQEEDGGDEEGVEEPLSSNLDELVQTAEASIAPDHFDDVDLSARALEQDEPAGDNGIPLVDIPETEKAWFEERAIRETFFTVRPTEFAIGDMVQEEEEEVIRQGPVVIGVGAGSRARRASQRGLVRGFDTEEEG